jgi:hypothetical protein
VGVGGTGRNSERSLERFAEGELGSVSGAGGDPREWGVSIVYFSRCVWSALDVSLRFLRPIAPIIGASSTNAPFGRISSS